MKVSAVTVAFARHISLRQGEVIRVPDRNLWPGQSRGDGFMKLFDNDVMVGRREKDRRIKEAATISLLWRFKASCQSVWQ